MGPAAYDRRLAVAGRARRRAGNDGDRAAVALYARARMPPIRPSTRRLRARLRHARRAARLQDSRHLRPARPARRQAAISASHAARMELSAALAGASRALAPLAAWYRANVPPLKRADERSKKRRRRAMVLAAGLGTRMRPLTDTMPKPLVQVAGRALIDHVLDRLADAGVERAVVNVHHFADQIERHLADAHAAADRDLRRARAAARHRRRRASRRCPSSATRRSSTSIPTPSGSTA